MHVQVAVTVAPPLHHTPAHHLQRLHSQTHARSHAHHLRASACQYGCIEYQNICGLSQPLADSPYDHCTNASHQSGDGCRGYEGLCMAVDGYTALVCVQGCLCQVRSNYQPNDGVSAAETPSCSILTAPQLVRLCATPSTPQTSNSCAG